MIWLITLNMVTGVSCLAGIYWLCKRQERSVRAQEKLEASVQFIQGGLAGSLAQRISEDVHKGLTNHLQATLEALSQAAVHTDPQEEPIPDPVPASRVKHSEPFALTHPISILGLSKSLMRKLPKKTQIKDLFATSTASLPLSSDLAHELNTALVAYAAQNFRDLDGFQAIIDTRLTYYHLPGVVDDHVLETIGDAIHHQWSDPHAERHFALALRRIFSQFILDLWVPGFKELCKRELKTFELTTRLSNLLRSRNMARVEDLISHTVPSLKSIVNFGNKSVQEIELRILQPNGLHFGTLDSI